MADDERKVIAVGTDPPAITQLKQLLQSPEFEVVSDNGKVHPPKNDVFQKLSDAMSEPLRKKPKNIYTIILENRYNTLTEILESRKIISCNATTMNDSLDSTLDSVLEFKLDLTKVWPDMEPDVVNYDFQSRGKRQLRKLKRHSWTHALYDAIFDETKMPCALNFKNNEISDSGFYVKITGECPDCKAKFLGRIINTPSENEPIEMECFIYGFDRSVTHKTKRQLKGARRQKVAKEIVEGNLLPCTWRRKEGDRLIESIGDDEPAHIPRGQILGKAATEMRDKILGLIKTHDVFESFQDMKYDSIYETSIHSIGFIEFFVHYWSKEQLAVYEKFHETLYIDGTGSVVRKIKRPSGYSPHVYLYQAVAQANGKTVPVFQMLSAEHHTDAIAKWLFEFLRTGSKEKSSFPVPREVVTDFDKALLGGVARAFAQESSLKKYLATCFEFLTGRVPTAPACILRLDICHFINMVAKWKCYSGTPFGAKSMCVRAVAVLRHQETLGAFEAVAKQIFMLVLSRNAGNESLSDRARIRITALIRGIPRIDMSDPDTEDDSDHDGKLEDFEEKDSLASKYHELLNSTEEVPVNTWEWADNLYQECVAQVQNEPISRSGNVNGFHNAKFAKHLKNLLPYFPLFSETMRIACGRGTQNATSAAVESEFNDLKNRTLINVRQPLRADRFVATHILSLPGKIKLALAGQSEKDACLEVERWNEGHSTESKKENDHIDTLKRKEEEEEGGKSPERSRSPSNSISIREDTDALEYSKESLGNIVKPPEESIVQPADASWTSVEQSASHCVQTSPEYVHSNQVHHEPVQHHMDDCHDLHSHDSVVMKPRGPKRQRSSSPETVPGINANFSADSDVQISPLKESNANTEYASGRKRRRPLPVRTKKAVDFVKEAVVELKEQHDWRNKNKSAKKPGYTKAFPNFDSANIQKYTSLPLLPNGNHCKNVHDKSTIFLVKNTCGFDSVCQILAMVVSNDVGYKSIVGNRSGIYKCIEILISKGLVSEIFKERAHVLHTLPRVSKEIEGDIVRICAGSNLTNLIEDLLAHTPSYVLKCSCSQCGHETEHPRVFLDINYNPLTSKGITALDQAVALGRFVSEKCCGMTGTQTITYGPHLFLDVDTGRSNRDTLRDVPKTLTVSDGTRYKLAGVVEYQGPKCINSLGHYIAYCWTGLHWLRYNDNARNKLSQTVSDTISMEMHVCIYVHEKR